MLQLVAGRQPGICELTGQAEWIAFFRLKRLTEPDALAVAAL